MLTMLPPFRHIVLLSRGGVAEFPGYATLRTTQLVRSNAAEHLQKVLCRSLRRTWRETSYPSTRHRNEAMRLRGSPPRRARRISRWWELASPPTGGLADASHCSTFEENRAYGRSHSRIPKGASLCP